MSSLKAYIIFAPGTNCERETRYALEQTGFVADIVPLKDAINNFKKIHDYHLFVIPGGFSFGDDIKAGKVLALYLKNFFFEELKKFYEDGKLILGICNGFQVLVRAGILPFFDGKQWASLELNSGGAFEDRWVFLKKERKTPFTEFMNDISPIPIAHAEGRFTAGRETLEKIERENLVVFKYCDEKGNIKNEYPVNPNGSLNGIAGICDKNGQVLGLMPHPERAFEEHHFPESVSIRNTGKSFFKGVFEYIKQRF